MKIRIFLAVMLSTFSFSANALESFVGKVSELEPSYMPNLLVFKMDAGNSTCPIGTWLKWGKDLESNKVIYSTLLAAMMSNKTVRFHFNDGDTSCNGTHLHLLLEP